VAQWRRAPAGRRAPGAQDVHFEAGARWIPSHLMIVFDNCRVVLAGQLLDPKSGDVIGYSDHLGLGGPQVSQGARDSGSTRLRAWFSEGSIPLPTHRTV